MSDTLLNLVNRVIRTTGDSKEISTVTGSLIGERITDFLNQTLGDVEQVANWPRLRVNAQGIGDGADDIFEFTGSDNVREDGPVDVWMPNISPLEELTAAQFDKQLAMNNSGTPLWFQRGVASSGLVQIQINPTPANGDTINMSAYKRATRFSSIVDTGTTEFDDDILIYGALMHMDAYDGLSRGYAALFKNHLENKVLSVYSNRIITVHVDSYR